MQWFKIDKLQINTLKTKVMIISSRPVISPDEDTKVAKKIGFLVRISNKLSLWARIYIWARVI